MIKVSYLDVISSVLIILSQKPQRTDSSHHLLGSQNQLNLVASQISVNGLLVLVLTLPFNHLSFSNQWAAIPPQNVGLEHQRLTLSLSEIL